ncbi:MAG: hypothetical protein IPM29_26735 [Planctomycetes bacterium]|nr:hypothetical protein [Planctomycetota bacterium]
MRTQWFTRRIEAAGFLFVGLLAGWCPAQAGDLDTTFGVGGKVTTGFLGSADNGACAAFVAQSDGRILVAGTRQTWAGDFLLARYDSDGSPDMTFGVAGLVTTDFANVDEGAAAAAIQVDGKIVVAGRRSAPNGDDFALVRYNPDGTLDSSFGSGGLVTTDFGFSSDQANAVAIGADGRIVAVGNTSGNAGDFALACYNPDGSLDTTFGSTGRVTTQFGASYDMANAVTIQADGRIIAAGQSYDLNTHRANFALARYNADGTLDGSFGDGGKVTTAFGPDSLVMAAVLQGDERIVVAGRMGSSDPDFALARYHTDGSLDTTFGIGGKVTTPAPQWESANALAIDVYGRIVAAGQVRTPLYWTNDFVVVRYTPNGSLDTTFGSGGRVSTDFVSSDDGASAVTIQADGGVIAVGSAGRRPFMVGSTGQNWDIALARYSSNGNLDATFGTGGKVITDVEGVTSDRADDIVAAQADGKIIAVGTRSDANGEDFALARFNHDGSLDPTFGDGGLVTTDFQQYNDEAFGVALQADNRIVVVGRRRAPGVYSGAILVRYEVDGSLDASFGSDGMVAVDDEIYWGIAMGIQADGRIVVTGSNSDREFCVARHNTDGSEDTTFGIHGKVTTYVGSGARAYAVTIQGDGKIVVAGDVDGDVDQDFVLVRYNTNGSLDTTFGNSGKVTTDFGGSESAQALTIQADGKIVAGGYTPSLQ